jgi:DNA-binding NarL/FixJ family response regulator
MSDPRPLPTIGIVPTANRVRVAIVADAEGEREKLSELVIGARQFMVVGSHSTRTGESELSRASPDVILGYVRSDHEYSRFRELARQFIDIPSLLLVSDLEQLSDGGADEAINCVVDLVRRTRVDGVFGGLRTVSVENSVTGVPVSDALAEDREKLGRLTPREREVLVRTAEGLSMKEIAARLNRSYGTIASHRNAMMRKIGIHDKVALTRFAIRTDLIEA